ncbi:MAG: PTS fructose transporter subunit IIC [Propionibacteriaceae bacterium]|nr:PTS fructose transporter subunit IIC [Propionibacteriaceae bacterium]
MSETAKTGTGIPRFWQNWGKYFGTGASYMVPVVIIGGLGTGLAQVFGASYADPEAGSEFAKFLMSLGSVGMNLFVPVLAAYLAFSIADRVALAPGLVTGYFAVQLGTGFIGAMIAGFLAGYISRVAIRKVKLPDSLTPAWQLIVPFLVTLAIGAAFQWVIGPPITALSDGLTGWLTALSAGGASAVVLGIILGALTGVDAGGPFNKVAFMFGLAGLGSGVFEPMAMVMSAAPVPSIGLGIAALVGAKYFTEDEREFSGGALTLGLVVGFSEGAIPFLVNDLIRVAIAAATGGAVASALAGAFSLSVPAPGAAIIGTLLFSNPLLYWVCVLSGAAVCAALVIILKRFVRFGAKGALA